MITLSSLKSRNNLKRCRLSPNGQKLATQDASGTQVFDLESEAGTESLLAYTNRILR